MLEKHLDVLAECELFKDMGRADLMTMLACFKPVQKDYKKGELLAREGEKFHGIGIILSGEAVVIRENSVGDRVIIEIVSPGKMFGEMAAYSGTGVWPATVAAQNTCRAVFIPAGKIAANCEKQCTMHKQLIANMLMIVSNKAMQLNKKVEYLTMKTLRGKISAYLLDYFHTVGKSTFMLPLNRNDLADYLNVSRPSLSRELCRMKNEGLIDFHMSSVRIKDAVELGRMVQ